MKYISRINTIFTDEFLDEMFDLYKQHKFYIENSDGTKVRVDDVRHMKALKFREKLTNYFTDNGISFTFLGDGTNRMAFLVDGYVFKLALDDQGYIDNLTEFKMSKEAQPYVTKTYETNGLFCVAEYVTLISYDEFVKQKARILDILDLLSSEYLLGDMGWTKKNYCNWGYRKNSKDLVILDYGHMLKIDPDKMICQDCGGFLHYNSTFTEIQCISCSKKTDFINMKSRISKREEMEMIDKYLNNSIKTDEEQIEVEDSKVQEEVYYEEESEEIVSNRFELFKPEGRRRFSDMMDDEEEYEEEYEENEYNFNDMVGLLDTKQVKPKPVVKERIPNELNKIQDLKLRGLLMMDREDAEFTLSQELATGQMDFKDYGYYMSKIEDYYNEPEVDEEQEEIATIEEVVKVKQQHKKEDVKIIVETEDPYDNFDYYDQMLSIVTEENAEVVQPPVQEEEEEEVVEDLDMNMKMNQMMQNLVDMDDYDEGDLYPEDFIANNLSNLGFDEEDDEEDIKAFDAVLENIRKGNNVDLDELEEMLEEEEEETNNEEEFIATLEIFDPTVKENKVEDVKEEVQENIIRLENETKPNDNIFKVRRNSDSNKILMGNESKLEVKRKEVKEEVQLKVNEVNEVDDSLMSKVFRQMQETGIIHSIDNNDDEEEE